MTLTRSGVGTDIFTFEVPGEGVAVMATFVKEENVIGDWAKLQARLNAAPDGVVTTVTLTGDLTAGETDTALVVSSDKRIILDLKGYALTGSAAADLTVEGTLTLKDSADTKGKLACQVSVAEDGKFILDGAKIDTSALACAAVITAGQTEIRSGTVSGTTCVAVNEDGSAVITGGSNYIDTYVYLGLFTLAHGEYQIVVLPGYLKSSSGSGNRHLVMVYAKDAALRFKYDNVSLYKVDSSMGYRVYEADGTTLKKDYAGQDLNPDYTNIFCYVTAADTTEVGAVDTAAIAANVKLAPAKTVPSGTIKAPKVGTKYNARNVNSSADGIHIDDAVSVLDMATDGAKRASIALILRADVDRNGKINASLDAESIKNYLLGIG